MVAAAFAATFVDFGSAYTSNVFVESLQSDFAASRHSAHIRVGPADFGMPAPTQEERSALTKSASPPAKPTFRENRIEVAFSDRIEDTACISSTAWTISIMEKVASWVALDLAASRRIGATAGRARQHPRRFRSQWETRLPCRRPRLR